MVHIRQWLLALVRPGRTFADWQPSLRIAAVVVCLLALANAAGVAVGGEVIKVVIPISAAGNAAMGMAFTSFFLTLVEWLLVAAIVALFIPSDSHRGFGELLTIAGWGMMPAVFRYVTRPLFVERTVGLWDYPGTIDTIRPAARAFVAGNETTLFVVIVATTLFWQAAIYAYGFAARTDASFRRAVVIVGVPAIVLAGLFWSRVGVAPAELTVYGGMLLVFALPSVAAPHLLARFSEQVDSIGSTRRWGDVEPAGWNVWLTRAIGTAMLVGAFWLFGGPLFV